MYKKDLALNKLQWLICLKTKPNGYQLSLIDNKDYKITNSDLKFDFSSSVNKYFS